MLLMSKLMELRAVGIEREDLLRDCAIGRGWRRPPPAGHEVDGDRHHGDGG